MFEPRDFTQKLTCISKLSGVIQAQRKTQLPSARAFPLPECRRAPRWRAGLGLTLGLLGVGFSLSLTHSLVPYHRKVTLAARLIVGYSLQLSPISASPRHVALTNRLTNQARLSCA